METARFSRANFLLSGVVGCGKSSLAKACAEALGWTYLDPEDQLVEREGKPIFILCKEHGNKQVSVWLEEIIFSLLLDGVQQVIPYPTLLRKKPSSFHRLLGSRACFISLEGMPMEIYERIIQRELEPGPYPELAESEEDLRRKGAKLFFYHRLWEGGKRWEEAHFHCRVTGDLPKDCQHLLRKIFAIQSLPSE